MSAWVVALAACASLPEPVTHTEWLERQLEIWNSIRECNPDMAMCHRRRDRLNASNGCFPPNYPSEAKKKNQQGRTQIRIEVAADGQVSAVRLLKSSGHKSLDDASTQGFSACRFPPHLAPQTEAGSQFDLEYRWSLKDAGEGAFIQRRPVHLAPG